MYNWRAPHSRGYIYCRSLYVAFQWLIPNGKIWENRPWNYAIEMKNVKQSP